MERARRLAGLRLQALFLAVSDIGDSEGWARLTAIGTRTIIEAQDEAADAVGDYLIGTLADSRVAANSLTIESPLGVLTSDQTVARFLAASRNATGARMSQGAPFAQALQSTSTVVVGVGASEPHRIGRSATFTTGARDERFQRWQRIAEPGACAWCRMAASRGAVYYSRDTAYSVASPARGHSHCRCRIVEVVGADAIEKSRDLGAQDWKRMQSDQATAFRRGTTPEAQARQLMPDNYAGSAQRRIDLQNQRARLEAQLSDGSITDWGRSRLDDIQKELTSGQFIGETKLPKPGIYDRVTSAAQEAAVLRRQINDGTASQWTRDRLTVLEAQAAA